MYFVNSFFVDSFREMIKKYGEMGIYQSKVH